MPRVAKELSALQISRLSTPGHHAVGGVTGLYLYITDSGSKAWVLRTVIAGKRRHMGLGAYPSVSLAQSREKARLARSTIENGQDPISSRKESASQLKAQMAKAKTFEECTRAYLESHGDSWKNTKHRAQWLSTLETYAFPTIGSLQVGHVEQSHVLGILEPIWKTKNETASRLRGRIEAVLNWATVRGFRQGENPALWKGRLDKLLPAPSKIQKSAHHKALPISDIPKFIKDLQNRSGSSARALEFCIQTAVRSGEVRSAAWDEIDMKNGVWVIPAERMKSNKEHRVPLSRQSLSLLEALPRVDDSDLVFPSPQGKVLSDMALLSLVRKMNVPAVPHGFRSTFRDWVGEKTNYPRELAEQALAHALENKVEAAYRRGDALDKRRIMMQDWSDYMYTPEQNAINN